MSGTTVIFIVCAAVFICALPFIPGWLELRRPRDNKPLRIDGDYQKNPFFFGDSFRALLQKAMPATFPPGHSDAQVTLSRIEKVHIVSEPVWVCEPSTQTSRVLYVDGDMQAGSKDVFKKEVFVSGNSTIGDASRLQAILCQGNLSLGKDTRVVRWVDVRGNSLIVATSCKLGRSTACKGMLHLAIGTTFGNLYGLPIKSYTRKSGDAPPRGGDIRESSLVASPELFSIPSQARIESNVVSRQDLKLCAGCEIKGDIKAYSDIELQDGVVVHGNIVAEGDVLVGENSRIYGNIFSQGKITCLAGSSVGVEGQTRSVVCRTVVILYNDVTIYGAVSCNRGWVA